jgi:hypothetical protein
MSLLIQRSYVLSRVFATREKIVKFAEPLVDRQLSETDFEKLLWAFTRSLPRNIPDAVLRESLIHLAARRLSREMLVEEAWRLAGNVERLQQFHPVPPWNRQVCDEYVPVQVTGVLPQERDKREYAELTLRVLAGTPAPSVIRKTWSKKFCAWMARSLGFPRPWQPSHFEDVRQLAGLQFYALIEQRLCGTLPVFEKVWTDAEDRKVRPPSCYDHNRTLINLRYRPLSAYPCPGKFKPAAPCHACPLGLEACPLAVHTKTFKTQWCRHCQKEAAFDSELSAVMCAKCFIGYSKG